MLRVPLPPLRPAFLLQVNYCGQQVSQRLEDSLQAAVQPSLDLAPGAAPPNFTHWPGVRVDSPDSKEGSSRLRH